MMRHESAAVATEWVAVGPESLMKAQTRVEACQFCSPSVSRPFSSVVVEVLGAANPVCQYLLSAPAECPSCAQPLVEDTLVRCEGERQSNASTLADVYVPCLEESNVMLVNESLLEEAQAFISGCEQCAENVGVPFDYILDAVTESDPTITDYVMCRPAQCPQCSGEIAEKTLVVTAGDEHIA